MKTSFVIWVLVFVQILFGINFSASKVIVEKVDPLYWSNLRFFFAGLGMIILSILLKRKRPVFDKEFLGKSFVLSILGMSLGQGLFLIGLEKTTSVNSAILISTIPIFTLLIVVLRAQTHLTYQKILGVFIAFFGVICIRDISSIHLNSSSFFGDIIILICALLFALYLSFGKNYFIKYDAFWSTGIMFLFATLTLVPVTILTVESYHIPNDNLFISSALFSIFGATLLTYFLNNWALKKISPDRVALFIYLQPLVAAIIGHVFLDEYITLRIFICSILIVFGVILSKETFKRKAN